MSWIFCVILRLWWRQVTSSFFKQFVQWKCLPWWNNGQINIFLKQPQWMFSWDLTNLVASNLHQNCRQFFSTFAWKGLAFKHRNWIRGRITYENAVLLNDRIGVPLGLQFLKATQCGRQTLSNIGMRLAFAPDQPMGNDSWMESDKKQPTTYSSFSIALNTLAGVENGPKLSVVKLGKQSAAW